ncbi:MAG: right-handed parallel beta-helix repeat-containing protein [Verrucomicrobiales bacterium]|nr:right-handed parallel beta-helix repeat-containing protein [Verrucomicrobiales bacterium]
MSGNLKSAVPSWLPRAGFSRLPAFAFVLLAAILAPRTFPAQLPIKHFAATNLPPEMDGTSVRLDNARKVFGTSRTIPTEFLIYNPAATGPNPGSVRRIPSPVVPNLRRFGIVDVNQMGQFITWQTPQQGNGHNFLWDGGKFNEFKPLPPDDKPLTELGYPNLVGSWLTHPQSIHEDGSIWGYVDPTFGKSGDFGSEVRWNAAGEPTVTFAFRSESDPLRVGPFRNEKGSFLRYTYLPSGLGEAAYWDGQSTALKNPIPHPISVAMQINDLDEVAGISVATHEVWLYLPSTNYGFSAGYHLLSGVTAASQPGLFLNNIGQIFVATTDAAQPLAVWEQGLWRAAQVDDDANNRGLEIRAISDSNSRGELLSYLGVKGGPPATLKQFILTPSTNLAVRSSITPIRMEIGDTFDLQLDIRNDAFVPLNKVGIVVSSLGLFGAILADWIKAPPSLLSLAPDATGTLHYVFRAKAAGKAQLQFQVEGLNAAGQRQTITPRLFSPIFTVLGEKGDLLIKRDADPAAQFGLNDVYQTIPAGGQIVTNSTTANLPSQFQIQVQNDGTNSATFHLNAIESGTTGWDIKYFSGSQNISAEVRTLLGVEFPRLAPKQSYLIDVSMTPTNAPANALARVQLFLSVTNASAALMTLDAVEAVCQRVDVAGDLLVRRTSEPVSAFGLDNVYQAQPAGFQIRTNMAGQNAPSVFELQIQNDAKVPQSFRLKVNESANDGWKPVRYSFDGNDIGARLRATGGYDFPVLGTNKNYLLEVEMTPTNATPGSQFRASFALSTTNSPTVILDAAEMVAEIPFEIIVNSTGDRPLGPSVTCCCDTGEKLADGVTAECTLRAAIEIANKHAGKDTIKFHIPIEDLGKEMEVPTILPENALPDVTDPVIIDGWSQSPNTPHPPIQLRGTKLSRPPLPNGRWRPIPRAGFEIYSEPNDEVATSIVEPEIVRFTDWSDAASGLHVVAADCEIRGLVINQFPMCGLLVDGDATKIQGNYLGLDPSGLSARANGLGVTYSIGNPGALRFDLQAADSIRGAQLCIRSAGNIIGGGSPRLRNVISGRSGDLTWANTEPDSGGNTGATPAELIEGRLHNKMPPGILILGGRANNNTIQGNWIGLSGQGDDVPRDTFAGPVAFAELAQTGPCAGILIYESSNNLVGGIEEAEGNVVSGNLMGIWLDGPGATGNHILGNQIGTDIRGHSIPSYQRVGKGAAQYGSYLAVGGNLFNLAEQNASNPDAVMPVFYGIVVTHNASGNDIGASAPHGGNHFNGVATGVRVQTLISSDIPDSGLPNRTSGLRILGNRFGASVQWPEDPFAMSGVALFETINSTIEQNVFVRNSSAILFDIGNGNRIEGNTIESSVRYGINLDAQVGMTVRRNVIANTGKGSSGDETFAIPGIYIYAGPTGEFLPIEQRIRITENSIHGSVGLGYSLRGGSPFPAPNDGDSGDLDSGPNTLLDFPVIRKAVLAKDTLVVVGTLVTAIGIRTYHIEFFANQSCPDGFGEGERFLGSLDATSDLSGRANIDFTTRVTRVFPGEYLTATATDPEGNTSEFSQCVQIQGGIDADADSVSDDLESLRPNRKARLKSLSSFGVSRFDLAGDGGAYGDGNGDGVPDSQQANVASLRGLNGEWMTLDVASGFVLQEVGQATFPDLANIPPDFRFPAKFLRFRVTGLSRGGSVDVTNIVDGGLAYDAVYGFGPTTDRPTPHWFEFPVGSFTPFAIGSDQVVIHFTDGALGDVDATADGTVTAFIGLALKRFPAPTLGVLFQGAGTNVVMQFGDTRFGPPTISTTNLFVVTNILFWPTSPDFYELEYAPSLSSSNAWSAIPTTEGNPQGLNFITNATPRTTGFYRLRKY